MVLFAVLYLLLQGLRNILHGKLKSACTFIYKKRFEKTDALLNARRTAQSCGDVIIFTRRNRSRKREIIAAIAAGQPNMKY